MVENCIWAVDSYGALWFLQRSRTPGFGWQTTGGAGGGRKEFVSWLWYRRSEFEVSDAVSVGGGGSADGDRRWHDLQEDAEAGLLQWLNAFVNF